MIDFEKTLTLLSDAGVRFVIVGGLAITIHGSAYVTFDLDICYARDGENLARLAGALRPVNPRLRGAPAGLPFRFDEETLKRGLNFTLSTDVGEVDLIGEVAGVGDYTQAAVASERGSLMLALPVVFTVHPNLTAFQPHGVGIALLLPVKYLAE